ncbi:hypothetical protein ES706_03805 [subsurface metagenome]
MIKNITIIEKKVHSKRSALLNRKNRYNMKIILIGINFIIMGTPSKLVVLTPVTQFK